MPSHHALDYVELSSTDLDTTIAFYENVFGWSFTRYGDAYAGIQAPDGDGEVGGIAAGAEPTPGGPFVMLFSDDLDATAEAVTAAGGSITDGPYEFPGGRRFHFTDPTGNALGVWATA